MNAKLQVGWIGAVLVLGVGPLRAQTVEAGVVVHSGPVSGHVVIGEPPPVIVYREPVRQILVVEEIYLPDGHAYGWWEEHGYEPVTVYYDGDSYYERWFKHRPGLRKVVLYERQGRYYRWDDRGERHRHHGHGHKHHEDDD